MYDICIVEYIIGILSGWLIYIIIHTGEKRNIFKVVIKSPIKYVYNVCEIYIKCLHITIYIAKYLV